LEEELKFTSTRTFPCRPTCPELCQAASVCVTSSISVAGQPGLLVGAVASGLRQRPLADLPSNQLDRLQSVLNAAARLVFLAQK